MGPLSLRQKMSCHFILLAVLVGTAGLLAAGMVLRVDKTIFLSRVMDDVLATVFELRRYEREYLLTAREADFRGNQASLEKLQQDLRDRPREISALFSRQEMEMLAELLASYRDKMRRLELLRTNPLPGTGGEDDIAALTAEIETTSRALTDLALASRPAKGTASLLLDTYTGPVPLAAGLLILFLLLFAGVVGSRLFFELKRLQEVSRRICRGQPVDLGGRNDSRELLTLVRTYTRIRELIRFYRDQMIRNEKPAAVGTMLAGVAHELNNPLSNITTSVRILAEELESADPAYRTKLIGRIESQSAKAMRIVRTLLDFSLTRDFRKERVLFRELLDDTLQLLRCDTPPTITFQINAPEGLTLEVDKQRLQQVFLNLFKNSVDAMAGRGHIRIGAREILSEKRPKETEITVTDNGPGITPEILPKIFTPFYTTKEAGKGSGLGLVIVEEIIGKHGGTIRVASEPGHGTTFVIRLPAAKEASKEANDE